MSKNNQIVINYIPAARYARLVAVAARLGISLNNLVRRRLHIPDAKPGNPTGNKGRKINQPKGKKRKAKEQPE
jgi:hypothetical protein